MNFLPKSSNQPAIIEDEIIVTKDLDLTINNEEAIICGDCTIIPPNTDNNNLIPPVDRIIYPCDIVDIHEDDETIYIIGTKEGKVTKIKGLENNRKLKVIYNIF